MSYKADVLLTIPATSTVGAAAIDRPSNVVWTNRVIIEASGRATVRGIITQIEIWAYTNMADPRVGSHYLTATNTFSTRDYAKLGAVVAGAKRTFTEDSDGKPLAIQVEVDDYIGYSCTSGAIELSITGGTNIWYPSAGNIIPVTALLCSLVADYQVSLKGNPPTQTGHKLVSDKSGNLAWLVEEAPMLRAGQAMGPVSYADVPPEQELTWDQQYSMHGGFGQLDWADPTRYLAASGVDARKRGKVFCGPLLITGALDPALEGLNGPIHCGCEHDRGFYIGAGHAVYQNRRPYTMISTAATITITFATNKTITLGGTTNPTWDTEAIVAGRLIVISGTALNGTTAAPKRFSVESVTSTVITVSEVVAAETSAAGFKLTTDFWRLVWDAGSGTITFVVSSNGYVLAGSDEGSYCYSADGGYGPYSVISTAISFTALTKTIAIVDAVGNPKFNTTRYAVGSTIVIEGAAQSGNNGQKTVASRTTTTIVVSETLTDEAAGASVKITAGTGTWTLGPGGDANYFNFMCPLEGNLWGFRGENIARVSSVSPPSLSTHWSGEYKVGDTSYDYTWALNYRDILLIGKQDGLYSIDQYGNAHHVLTREAMTPTLMNLRRMAAFHGTVFMPIGLGGLLTWNESGQVGDLSPRRFAPYDPNYHDIVGGLAPDVNWLWAVEKGSAHGTDDFNIGLLAGCWQTDELGTRWVWHPLASWLDDDAHYALIVLAATTHQPRLWISRGTAGYTPSYINLPRFTDNPLEAGDDQATAYAYYFASNGWLITSIWDSGLRGMTKAFTRLTFRGSNLSNNGAEQRYITADYRIDNGAWVPAATSGFTLAATAGQDGVEKEQTFSVPSTATGKFIQLRFNLYTVAASGNPVETPVLELPFILRAIPRPESRRQGSFSVVCQDNAADNLSAAQIRTAWNKAKGNDWPVTIVGPDGDSYTCTILSGYPKERAVRRKLPNNKVESIIDIGWLESKLA